MLNIPDSVTLHQPHFLPWYPYILRILASEEYVVYDSANYKPQYFHGRTRFIDRNGKSFWGGIPIKGNQKNPLNECYIDIEHKKKGIAKLIKRLSHEYGNSQYFEEVIEQVKSLFHKIIIDEGDMGPCDINVAGLRVLASIICIDTPKIVRVSDYKINSNDRTDFLLKVVNISQKSHYLCGWGGSLDGDIFDIKKMRESGTKFIGIKKEDINPEYTAIEGVSILHYLFKYGPKKVRKDYESNVKDFQEVELK